MEKMTFKDLIVKFLYHHWRKVLWLVVISLVVGGSMYTGFRYGQTHEEPKPCICE